MTINEILQEAIEKIKSGATAINLSKSEIDDEGAIALAAALKSENCKLEKLNLGGNEIGNEGAEALADALKSVNCNLKEIYLRGNKISDAGATSLAEAAPEPDTKTLLNNLFVE